MLGLRKFGLLNKWIESSSRLVFLSCRCNSSKSDEKLVTMKEVRDIITGMVGVRSQWGADKIEAGLDGILQEVITDQSRLPARRPQESYTKVVIPLGSEAKTRDRYITFHRGIRFGRILEDFDTLAGMICYKHNENPDLGENQKSPYAFVTALVDRIELTPDAQMISPFKDIILSGLMTWVGRSSMEVTMHAEQEQESHLKRFITAKYLFVARNPLTQKAAVVNPLDPQTKEEKELFKKGENSKSRRVVQGKESLLKLPPTEDERVVIHNQFLSSLDLDSGTFRVRVKPPNTVWMEDTILKSLIICHPEQRNLYNKIFGGFLMRKAFELASTNASMYCNKLHPPCKISDDIVFMRPVEIGSLLFLSSQIVYTKGPDIQVSVHAEVYNPETNKRQVTNNFYFTFDSRIEELKQIMPKTYAESILYLMGKRRYET